MHILNFVLRIIVQNPKIRCTFFVHIPNSVLDWVSQRAKYKRIKLCLCLILCYIYFCKDLNLLCRNLCRYIISSYVLLWKFQNFLAAYLCTCLVLCYIELCKDLNLLYTDLCTIWFLYSVDLCTKPILTCICLRIDLILLLVDSSVNLFSLPLIRWLKKSCSYLICALH